MMLNLEGRIICVGIEIVGGDDRGFLKETPGDIASNTIVLNVSTRQAFKRRLYLAKAKNEQTPHAASSSIISENFSTYLPN